MDNVALRVLTPEDWEIFRAVRIRAVTLHTNYFMQTPQGAKDQPKEHWCDILSGQGKQVFGLFDADRLIGITAVFTWRDDPSGETGVLAMSFIEPDYRGQGYSDLFYKARIEFAIGHLPWKKLHVAHRKANEPSRRAILKHGFEFIGTNEIDWPDGTRDTECMYELDLVRLRD